MKKLLTLLLAVITCLTICSCIKDDPIGQEPSGDYMEFTAGFECGTKTALTNNNNVKWNATDNLSVSEGKNSSKFTIKTISTDGLTATFQGNAPSAGRFWALYPYQNGLVWGQGTVTASLPSVQKAVEGSFDDGASLAVAEVVNQNMYFKNVGGILAFGIQDDGIKAIRLTSKDGSPLSGKVTIDVPTATSKVIEGAGSIILKGNFIKGSTYYMTVLPGVHQAGFTLTFYKADGQSAEFSSSKPLTIGRNDNVDLFRMAIPQSKWKTEYRLVKDLSTLKAGDIVCLASSTRKAVVSAFNKDALTAMANSATISNESLQGPSVLEFTLAQNARGWTFQGPDGNFLGSGTSTALSMGAEPALWAMNIANDGTAEISSAATADRCLLHSTASNGVVKNYKKPSGAPGKTYALIQLYRKATLGDLGIDTTPVPVPKPEPDPEPVPQPDKKTVVWRMVQDASTLKAGEIFKIGNMENSKAAGSLLKDALSAEPATFAGNDMTCATAVEFTLSGTSGRWTLTTNGGVLSATSGSTALSFDGNTTWNISIEQGSGIASISAETGRQIYYDAKYAFKNYKKAANIRIYRRTEVTAGGGSEVIPPVAPTPSPTPLPEPDKSTPAMGQSLWLEIPGTQQTEKPSMYCVSHHAPMGRKQQRNYSILYDSDRYTSLWVAYPLCQTHMAGTTRKENWNQLDPRIPADKQQKVNVTYQTGYDRGHQLPDASRRGCAEMQEQTYYATNMTPQNGTFNRGIWKALEEAVRNSVPSTTGASDTVYVTTGAAFQSSPDALEPVTTIKHKGTNANLPVPNYYWKVILKVKRDSKGNITDAKTAAFWFPVATAVGKKFPGFETTVDDIETKTGFDFFVNLPDDIENRIEKEKGWDTFQNF